PAVMLNQIAQAGFDCRAANNSAQFSRLVLHTAMTSDMNIQMIRSTMLAIGLLLYAVAIPVHATTITVTNTNDPGPGSLRQALADANDGDTINFAVTGTIALTSGELLVNRSVTIFGPGAATLAVDGNATSRVFHIGPGK